MNRRDFLCASAALSGMAAAAAPVTPWQQHSDKKIHIGVVGGGFGLSFHWHQHPNCVVEAVSDLGAADGPVPLREVVRFAGGAGA